MFEIKKEYFTKEYMLRIVKYQRQRYALEIFKNNTGGCLLIMDGYKNIKTAEAELKTLYPDAIENIWLTALLKKSKRQDNIHYCRQYI